MTHDFDTSASSHPRLSEATPSPRHPTIPHERDNRPRSASCSDTNISTRKLWPAEVAAFKAHLLRLDRESRRRRFAHSVSDRFVEEYAETLTHRGAIVYGAFDSRSVLRATAELRKIGPNWAPTAEAAFAVEADFRNCGIGSRLMGLVIRSARNRGVAHLYLSCLAENATMQRIARKHDAYLTFEYGEVVGDIKPSASDLFSQFAEAVDDRFGILLAVMDLRKQTERH
ncbi:MAG: GNAT family N-acetyltransferase [Pseudomonadota bacterium]